MVWFGPVRSVSGLTRSVAAMDLSPAAREENETDRKSAQQRPVGSMQGRKAKRSAAGAIPEDAVDRYIFIRGAVMLTRNRWQASSDGRRNAGMQVCRNDSARVVGRGQAEQVEDRKRREPCKSACSSSAGVRAGPSRQVSDGSPRGGDGTRCRGNEVVCRYDRNHCTSTRSGQMRQR